MGLELARMFVRIRGDSTSLPEDFNEAKAVAESNMRDIADSMAGIFRKAQGIRGFLEKGIAGATQYEQTVTEFETLIGSAEKTQETLQNLTSFAVKTPFEMPQLLGVTRGLLQFGERGQELMGTLKMLGDVSQGSAPKFGTLGLVFNQVRAEGKLTRENFLQLANQGLISLQDVSKYLYGTTENTKAADKAMRDGNISFDTFRKILEKTTEAGGKNYNAMERQSTTLGGLNSTLSDAVNITARLLAEPLMPYMKALVGVQIKVAEGFSWIVREMGAASSGMAVGAAAVSTLGLALTSASLAARFFGISIRSAIIGTGVGAVLIALGAALGGVVMWIAEAVQKTAGWADTVAAVSAAWGVLYEAVEIVAASLMDVWESVFGASLTSSIGNAAEYIAGLIQNVAEWVLSVKATIISVSEGIAFAFRNAGNLMKLSITEAAITVLGVFQDIATGFVMVWAGAGGFFAAFVTNFIGGLTEVKNLAAAVWESIKAGFEAAFDPNVSVMDAMKRKFTEVLAEQENVNSVDPIEAAKQAAIEAGQEIQNSFNKDGSLMSGLEALRQDALDAIQREEELRNRRKPPEEEAAAAGEEEAKKEAPKAAPKVDTGRYGFEAFGNKFQDAILKTGQNDQQKKMVSLMEHANTTQDAILVEAQKKKGGLAP